jgi:hypothetical protein
MLWRMDSFLGNGREKTNRTISVAARQWTGWKTVFSARSALMAEHATIDTTIVTVFLVRSVPRYYKQDS